MVDQRPILLVKYGGSSLAKPEDFHAVAGHQRGLYESGSGPVLVNSARKGVSDRLIALYRREMKPGEYGDAERDFYGNVFRGRGDRDEFMHDLEEGLAEVRRVLEAGRGEMPETHRESYVVSHGETEAGVALQYLLRDFNPGIRFIDGRGAGIVATTMRGPVDIKASMHNIIQNRGNFCYGGFVGRDPANPGHCLLLDRNSTDVTAALVAAALGAGEYWNIKDVNGVYLCDPGILDAGEVPRVIERLSYAEAADITRSGSPILHPTGIIISEDNGVKIRITSIGNRGNGTLISAKSGTTPERPFAAISSGIYACVTIADRMMDVPGVGRGYAADVMGILSEAGYDILNLTGPGTAMSVLVAGGSEVAKGKGVDIGDLCAVMTRGLRQKGREGRVHAREIGSISITGAAMKGSCGLHKRIGQVMEEEGISISMIGQGDEYFMETPVIGFCVAPEDYRRAVNALRKRLF